MGTCVRVTSGSTCIPRTLYQTLTIPEVPTATYTFLVNQIVLFVGRACVPTQVSRRAVWDTLQPSHCNEHTAVDLPLFIIYTCDNTNTRQYGWTLGFPLCLHLDSNHQKQLEKCTIQTEMRREADLHQQSRCSSVPATHGVIPGHLHRGQRFHGIIRVHGRIFRW